MRGFPYVSTSQMLCTVSWNDRTISRRVQIRFAQYDVVGMTGGTSRQPTDHHKIAWPASAASGTDRPAKTAQETWTTAQHTLPNRAAYSKPRVPGCRCPLLCNTQKRRSVPKKACEGRTAGIGTALQRTGIRTRFCSRKLRVAPARRGRPGRRCGRGSGRFEAGFRYNCRIPVQNFVE